MDIKRGFLTGVIVIVIFLLVLVCTNFLFGREKLDSVDLTELPKKSTILSNASTYVSLLSFFCDSTKARIYKVKEDNGKCTEECEKIYDSGFSLIEKYYGRVQEEFKNRGNQCWQSFNDKYIESEDSLSNEISKLKKLKVELYEPDFVEKMGNVCGTILQIKRNISVEKCLEN